MYEMADSMIYVRILVSLLDFDLKKKKTIVYKIV